MPHQGHVSGLGWEAERRACQARKEAALCGRHGMWIALSRVGISLHRPVLWGSGCSGLLTQRGQGPAALEILPWGPEAHTR